MPVGTGQFFLGHDHLGPSRAQRHLHGRLVGFIGLMVMSYAPISNPWLVHGLMAVALSCGVAMVGKTGGVHSPSLMWLVLLPNLALFFISLRATVFWMICVMLALGGVVLGTVEGVDQWEVRLIATNGTWTTLNLIMAQMVLMLVHLIYDAQFREKSKRISASMKRMKEVKQRLQLTESYKDRFISTVSEELRSPMNAILGYSDVLVDMAQQKPGLVETTLHIRNSIQHLLEITNNILDHAQLHDAKLQLQARAVPIKQLIEKEWTTGRVKDQVTFNVEVQEDMPAWLWCDPDRLKQIVHALVSNAKKFTVQGHILLKWSYQSQILKVDVVDTGVGITTEVQAHIFKRFDKVDEKINREYGGIGLGLANALELTKLFGGTLGFKSESQKGSHFWIRLPIQPYKLAVTNWAEQVSTAWLADACILVVDDHAVSLMVTLQMLRNAWPRAHLLSANSGAMAIDMLRAQHIDLVVLDVLMPQMDGPSTCRMIRQDLGLTQDQLKVVGLTASTHSKDKERCLDAGMNDVIVKPIDAPSFIRRLVKQGEQDEQLYPTNNKMKVQA